MWGGRSERRWEELLSAPDPCVVYRWLIDTFGAELLLSGGGVLDVAGGQGELSFELVNLNQVECTVVDPRPLNPKTSLRKLRVSRIRLGCV